MSTQKIAIKPFAMPFVLGLFALLLSSCGTQNAAYNRNDGIYASGERDNGEQSVNNNTDEYGKSNYYKQYFESKANTYGDISEGDEDVIFTDIEAYSTSERMDADGNIVIEDNYNDGYGEWGSNPEGLTVNVYNYGGYGYNYGFWNRPYYGYYGYYGNYWGYPYYGFYGPAWGIGFGWGWNYPYYGNYYPGYYGYGYTNYPYYPNYNNNVSYNRGRRNTDYNRTQVRGRANNSATNRSSYSRTENTRRINSNNVRANSNNTRQIRTNSPHVIRNNSNVRNTPSNSTIRNTRSSSPTSNGTIRQNNSSNVPSRTYSAPTRSSSPSVRSSSGSSIRSSGGGGRSNSGSSGGRGRN